MPRTADRIEEELEFLGTTDPLTVDGQMTFRSDLGAWRMRDALGEFDPRTGGGISEAQHEILDTLAHDIVEDSFDEVTRTGARVTNVTTWTDAGMTQKIREAQFTFTGSKLTQFVHIQYDGAGVEVYRITEVYAYIGANLVSTTRTRTP